MVRGGLLAFGLMVAGLGVAGGGRSAWAEDGAGAALERRLVRLASAPEVASAPEDYDGSLTQVRRALAAADARQGEGAHRARSIARAALVRLERKVALDRERAALREAERARDRAVAREAELRRRLGSDAAQGAFDAD